MSIKLSKMRHLLFLVTICLTNIIVMHDMVVLPIVNTLYDLFPEHVAAVNFIVSGPCLVMFISSLLTPYILKWVDKKLLLCLACGIFAISSIFEAAIVSLPYMIFTRSVCGFCYGIVQIIVLDLISAYFIDENKRASFMGIYNAAMAAIGAVMSMAAGNLAVSNWKHVYWAYYIAVPLTLMVIFCIPKIEVSSELAAEDEVEKTPIGSKFWIMLFTFIVFNICYTPMLSMAAVYIAENNLGNEAVAGLATSLSTIGSCVCCLIFGFLYSKLKARTSLISIGCVTLGLLAMYFFPNKILFIVICIVGGGAYGMLLTYIYAHVSSVVAPQNISRAISFVAAGNGLAMFSGTYVVTGLMGVVSTSTVTAVSLLLGIVLAVIFVIEFINTGRMK